VEGMQTINLSVVLNKPHVVLRCWSDKCLA